MMKKKLPSLFVCCLLLPFAYLYSGSYIELKKRLAFGRQFFLELIGSRKKVGHIFSTHPYWKKMPASFLLYAASYVYKHGGLLAASTNAFRKLSTNGPTEVWYIIMTEVRLSLLDEAKVHQRVLLILGKEPRPLPALLSFVKILRLNAYSFEVFSEKDLVPAQTLRALRLAGVRSVFFKNVNASPVDYLYEEGGSYRVILIAPDRLTHVLIDCIDNVMPHGTTFCVCEDSADLQNIAPDILKKLDTIVCRKSSLPLRQVKLVHLPAISEGISDSEFLSKSILFIDMCGLLSLAQLLDVYSKKKFCQVAFSNHPTVSFCLSAAASEEVARSALYILLRSASVNNISCEVLFWGESAPQWAQTLTIPWRFVATDDPHSIEAFCSLETACQGEFILFLKACTLFLRGLPDLLAVMRSSPESAICGCLLLDADKVLYEAGAYERNGEIVQFGRGVPISAPFYQVTRSVPLVSSKAFLVRKSARLFTEKNNALQFLKGAGGYIGLLPRSGHLTIMCAAAEVFFLSSGEGSMPELPKLGQSESERERDTMQLVAQDRYVPRPMRNRKNKSINILYYSPYQSHPASHGNRSTIQQFGKKFQAMGCIAHFALLGLDRHKLEDLQAMREAWDSVTVLPYPFQDNSYRGDNIPFDEWYEQGLGEHVAYLCFKYNIDLLFCSYVFQSKMLEFVPNHIVKVIDTHDKMANRYAAQKARGIKTEFFSCSSEDEGRYLQRADVVVARRAEEAEYFNEVSGKGTAIVIPHIEEPHFLECRFEKLHNVGLVASANIINLNLVTDFLLTLAAKTDNKPPVTVRVAGQVLAILEEVPQKKRWVFSEPWVQMLGFVENIEHFYASIDLVVSPVLYGTGINVKTVQAMSYGMPLVTTKCGCKGVDSCHAMHALTTIKEVVEAVLTLEKKPETLQKLAEYSRECYTDFYRISLKGFDSLLSICAEKYK